MLAEKMPSTHPSSPMLRRPLVASALHEVASQWCQQSSIPGSLSFSRKASQATGRYLDRGKMISRNPRQIMAISSVRSRNFWCITTPLK